MGSQHEDDDFPEPPRLRRLRWLVSGLTVALIVGVLAIAATIVIRLGFGIGEATGPVTAERFALPAGEIVSVGRGSGTVLFVLRLPDGAERLLVFDESTGEPAGASVIARDGG
jgi:hypothetical protein